MRDRAASISWAVLLSAGLLTVAGPLAQGLPKALPTQSAEPAISHLQLKITVAGQAVLVPFVDSKTTRAFIKLLPLTLTLDDIDGREKYSGLPARLPTEGQAPTTYEVGDLSYWLGGGLAAYYHKDSRRIKAGVVVLAKLGERAAPFNVPGPVKATFEAVEK
jgi:hypothetical protein